MNSYIERLKVFRDKVLAAVRKAIAFVKAKLTDIDSHL